MAGMRDDEEGGAGTAAASTLSWDVRETRIRLPRKVVHELKRVADAKGLTMNALIATYIDAGLKGDGRRGVHDLAPWFNAYLRRKGGPSSLADRPRDTGDDFT